MTRIPFLLVRTLARGRALVFTLAAFAAVTLTAQNRMSPAEARQQYQRGDRQYAQANYREAFDAYTRVSGAEDADLAVLARKGRVRSALRLAQFTVAHREASALRVERPDDEESMTLYGDSLWGEGWFDEAEQVYADTLARFPASSRARFGIARSLLTRGRAEEALTEALTAKQTSPQDVDILALIGHIYERLYRFREATAAYEECMVLLPKRLRNESTLGQSKLKVLRAFSGKTPLALDGDPLAVHVVPFRLDKNKIVVDGIVNGSRAEFIVDTGAELTTLSRSTANRAGLRPVAESMITGVGSSGILKLDTAIVDTLRLGTLTIRNFAASIRADNVRSAPMWQNETLSPMSLGLSVIVDYQKHELTLARRLPEVPADFTLPMRVYRLPMVRGLLNTQHPAYFVVDTGGELMSISTDVAGRLESLPTRRIRLRVFGTRGLDPDAFLLPGVDLDFNNIAYRKTGVAVLNLHAPSVLLGFRVGGILGHKFLAPYRVAMDMAKGELRLQRF